MSSHRPFLIVEDEPLAVRALERLLRDYEHLHVARDAWEADAFIRQGHLLVGAVVDVLIPSGCGLEVAARLRRLAPPVPVLVITGDGDRKWPNRAQCIGAEFAYKPVDGRCIQAFAERAWQTVAVHHRLAELARDHGLTPTEERVLQAAGERLSRIEMAGRLGIRQGTVKAHTRSILRKLGASRLADVVMELTDVG